MRAFMDRDFLLSTDTAKHLFHDYAERMPIADYHCHLDPREIYEDRKFENITQLWLRGDHYKWRQMRFNGVDERYITGDAPDREKFQKWAETLELAIGNPLYHWSHMELQRYFDFHGYLSGENAEEVWNLCNSRLQQEDMSVRAIIRKSGVSVICTTDDPADSLKWHSMLREDHTFETEVLPAWRPDKAMQIEKEEYPAYIRKLSEVSGVHISDFESLLQALSNRMDYFASMGCCISDHGLAYVPYVPASEKEIDVIMAKRLNGEALTEEECVKYTTACMLAMGKEYHRRGWVMQLHFGVRRDNDKRRFGILGPDTGFDCIGNQVSYAQLTEFLNALALTGELPRTILYSLNPNDNAAIGSIIGCFQDSSAVGKIQQGSAWWFNDHRKGMEEQLTSLANLGLLGNFIGMLTDSRSFLSYTRHEYFRRVFCDLIGRWVENGEYPEDETALKKIAEGVSYRNAVRYFGFECKE